MSGRSASAADRLEQPEPGRQIPPISEVIAVQALKHGVVELQLSCGHSVRRRLSLCPPKRLVCPSCRAAAVLGKAKT